MKVLILNTYVHTEDPYYEGFIDETHLVEDSFNLEEFEQEYEKVKETQTKSQFIKEKYSFGIYNNLTIYS